MTIEQTAQQPEIARPRIHLMDEIRGFAVLCMVFYHGFYLLSDVFYLPFFRSLLYFFMPAEPFFAAAFVGISGVASQLSRSNVKRGLKLAVVAVAVSLVTWLVVPQETILFGVLHMLSLCMILFGLLQKPLSHLPFWAGFAGCLILTLLTWGLNAPYPLTYVGIPGLVQWRLPLELQNTPGLFPFGIRGASFRSADYFPLFPWLFIFLAGSFLGRFAAAGRFPRFTYRSRVPFFSWIGRHALLIYILHQPVLYAVATVIQWIQG